MHFRALFLFALASTATLTTGCALTSEGADDVDAPAHAEDALRAKPKLLCASGADAPIYFGDESQILFTADVASDTKLENASLSMRANRNLGGTEAHLDAQATYRPRNPLYTDHQKFNMADAWCGYSVIAPKGLATRAAAFPVYVQEACEGGFIATATLRCRVTRPAPTP